MIKKEIMKAKDGKSKIIKLKSWNQKIETITKQKKNL